MTELNTALFQSLNELTRYDIISVLAPLVADLPIFFLPLFLMWMWIYYSVKNMKNLKEALLHIFYACVIVIFFSYLIKSQVDVPRPETAISEAWKLLLHKIPESSFPSDHASVSFAFLASLYFAKYKRVFWGFLPWVILMNICRIISGVHWPLDIIAWAFIWVFAAYLSFYQVIKIKFVKKVNSLIIQLMSYIKL